ncbi:hypothetical protein [Neobacillus mesonae]|uniref:Uncharacterized protein n=1 Tax=Neobacillus mesonae TaxID=1193713 RepID=A0A3T0HSI4_9BACI|nr:hypothetical protein [Neobacillus mesonae]AZU60102.1 hypothetical protein CHR53_01815 [Neobacillus mesonae]
MDKSYVVFTLHNGEELIGKPFNNMTANELKEYISARLKANSYVQVGKYGVPIESLKHYEVREGA